VLKRFLAWIEEYVDDVGIIGLTGPVMGILAFAGVLSVLIGSTAVKAGILVAVIFVVITMYIALLTRLRASQRQNMTNRRLLEHYGDILKRTLDYSLHISRLHQVAVIAPNGDTTETWTVHATVACKELHFFRWRSGPAWNQPKKYRERVSVDVRNVLINGAGGTRWNVTTTWLESDRARMELLAHFETPAPLGTEIRVTMEWKWPGKCVPLMKHREPDSFYIKFTDMIGEVHYTVILPEGEDAFYDPIGFDTNDPKYSITSNKNSQGNIEISFFGQNVPELHKVGMRLDLK
jgi:hypothetical protein